MVCSAFISLYYFFHDFAQNVALHVALHVAFHISHTLSLSIFLPKFWGPKNKKIFASMFTFKVLHTKFVCCFPRHAKNSPKHTFMCHIRKSYMCRLYIFYKLQHINKSPCYLFITSDFKIYQMMRTHYLSYLKRHMYQLLE